MALRNSRSERKRTILRYLVEEGPANKYRICKHFVPQSGSEPTYLTAIDEMEEEGLIKPSSVKEKAQGGRPSKHYDLSLRGLVALMGGVLGGAKTSSHIVTQLAQKTRYHDLIPDLFDLWPSIVRTGIEQLAFERLEEACCLHFYNVWDDSAVPDGDELGDFIKDFLLFPFGGQDKRKQWMESLSKNDVLRYAVVRMNINSARQNIEKLTADLNLMPTKQIEVTPELRSEIKDLGRELQRFADAARRVYGIA